jgi:hypothetical protein
MDLSGVRTQEIAIELVRRSKARLSGMIDAGYLTLAVLDSFRAAGLPDADDQIQDAEVFVENIIDVLADALARQAPDHPLVSVNRVAEWSSLPPDPAAAPE